MKIRWVAAMVLVLFALPAAAQMGGGGRRNHGEDAKADQKKTQADDKAYHDALKRIPDPKEKYDPWGGARPAANATAK